MSFVSFSTIVTALMSLAAADTAPDQKGNFLSAGLATWYNGYQAVHPG
jgi:hypothetical protein